MKGLVNTSKGLAEYLPSKTAPGALGPMDTYTALTYMGGPLLSTVELVSLYWGEFAQADINTMQAWLQGFAGYLSGVAAPIRQEPVLWQYGNFAASVGAWHQESPPPSNATEADVQSLITRLQGASLLPAFSTNRLFLVFTLGVTFGGYGTTWCAYHGSWGSGQYFAICPYPSSGGCGNANPTQSWQSVTSHEILEACTDPSVGTGWVEGGEEGGDVCAWEEFTMPFGTVQRFADNRQLACSVFTKKVGTAAAVGRNADGRLETFVVGTDQGMYHDWQTSPGGGWSGWNGLGGILTSEPVVVSNADGRLEAFVVGTDKGLYHNWQVSPGGGWSGWVGLGGSLESELAAITNFDGRIEIFAVASDNSLQHIWQTAPNNGWSNWASLGGVLTSDPAVGRNADGRLEAFTQGTDGALWHIWQTSAGGAWSGWASLGGVITSDPCVASNKDGRLEAFARGTDGGVYHIWQSSPGGAWSAWSGLGGVIAGDPAVASNKDGRLEVFARGTDGAIYHIWQNSPGGSWSGWNSLNGVLTSDPCIGVNADGRLEVFARGTDNALWHVWQIDLPLNIVVWSGWASLGGGIATEARPRVTVRPPTEVAVRKLGERVAAA